ncbi:MAG: tRNA (5-methylaminomethyl-2-thiouridylate)-methyltransferase [Acidiferrobacteraceae bacterium]|nr:tRNA (5-methylaminomethyl-2-thiouridylate)-methyltransferase [Acidiferrobacteraceae bacterium]|tara:strand:- start:4856 stop:5902 length:1047 start_codon:yes stop_codon:yes gene_type:complete
MNTANKPIRAVALLSGGLDSMLAARIVKDQGIYVEGLNFFTGFCVEGHTNSIRNHRPAKRNNALWVAEQLDIRLNIIDVIEEYKDVVINPKHGYGANLNPCLDCKSFMVGKARQWMEANSFDFIVTGEVLGQRPMSQRRDTFPIVQRESGANDLLLRPLCAKLLHPTLPERKAWVDRKQLHDFSGRGRRPQIELAKTLNIKDYAQPAGGCCFLTDPNYTAKLKDMWSARREKSYDLDDVMLLKVGRHLRPAQHYKMIIARDSGETNYLQGYRHRYDHLVMISHRGPITLLDGDVTSDDVFFAARIAARFGQGRKAPRVTFISVKPDGTERRISVAPLSPSEIMDSWYL